MSDLAYSPAPATGTVCHKCGDARWIGKGGPYSRTKWAGRYYHHACLPPAARNPDGPDLTTTRPTRTVFGPGNRVSDGQRYGTVVPHEDLAAWCRAQPTNRLVARLLAWVSPRPVPPPPVPSGRQYTDLVPVAWDDGSVSVTRARLYRVSPVPGTRRA